MTGRGMCEMNSNYDHSFKSNTFNIILISTIVMVTFKTIIISDGNAFSVQRFVY